MKKPAKPNSGPIKPPLILHPSVSFSFKYFAHIDPFLFEKGAIHYPLILFERLKSLCGMTELEMKTNRSASLRCHPIRWEETSKLDGFDHLNEVLRSQITPYQFEVSVNEQGRVHGFFIDGVFYVVWLDPAHKLYS